MNRELLKALGLSAEAVDTIMSAHGTSVNALRQEKSDLEKERDALKEQVGSFKSQVDELSGKLESGEDSVTKIQELSDKLAAQQQEHEEAMKKIKLDNEVESELRLAKARNNKSVLANLDMSKVQLGEDGKVTGLKEQLSALKETDAYLFETEEAQNNNKPTVRTSTGSHVTGGNSVNVPDIDPTDIKSLVALKRENPEAYQAYVDNLNK